VSITAKDSYGYVATGYNGAVKLTASNGQTLTVQVSNGRATVTFAPNHSGTITLTASAGNISGGSGSISVYPSLFTYTFMLYAYDSDGAVVAREPFTCTAQNDTQAAQFVHNEAIVWGGQLDDAEIDWSTIAHVLESKSAAN
jgi:hypothetical protein